MKNQHMPLREAGHREREYAAKVFEDHRLYEVFSWKWFLDHAEYDPSADTIRVWAPMQWEVLRP